LEYFGAKLRLITLPTSLICYTLRVIHITGDQIVIDTAINGQLPQARDAIQPCNLQEAHGGFIDKPEDFADLPIRGVYES
jgi:hypothetical protein